MISSWQVKKHRDEWKAIEEQIKVSTPCQVGRVLGVHFGFKDGLTPNLKHVTMDMDNYAQQAIDMYHKVPNAPPLRGNVHYP